MHLTDGRYAPYDRLLIATGARPFVPGIPGLELGNVFTFHSMADAEAIVAAARDAQQVVERAVVADAALSGEQSGTAVRDERASGLHVLPQPRGHLIGDATGQREDEDSMRVR